MFRFVSMPKRSTGSDKQANKQKSKGNNSRVLIASPDLDYVKEQARGCRPGHEFMLLRTRKGDRGDRGLPRGIVQRIEYVCMHADCPVTRSVITKTAPADKEQAQAQVQAQARDPPQVQVRRSARNKSKSKSKPAVKHKKTKSSSKASAPPASAPDLPPSTVPSSEQSHETVHTLLEEGEHIDDHDPVYRGKYSWSAKQRTSMEKFVRQKPRITAKELYAEMKRAKCLDGCEHNHVVNWLKTARKPTCEEPDLRVTQLRALVEELKAATDKRQRDDEHAPMLLEIPDRQHLLVGDEIPVGDRTSVKTAAGTPISYTFPMSTRKLLNTSTESTEVTYKRFVEVTLKDGAIMKEVESLGLTTIDGNFKVVRGNRPLISFGSTTISGHHRKKAIAVASSESALCVDGALDAVQSEEQVPTDWMSSDAGLGMVGGLQRQKERVGNEEPQVSCSVHLTEDDMPKHKHKLVDRLNYDKFRGHVASCKQFAPPTHRVAVDAMLQEWRARGEDDFAGWFFENHVKINSGWGDGALALGVPTHQNAIERDHRNVNKDVGAALREVNPTARLPAPLIDVIRALFYKCIPKWSKEQELFETFTETSAGDRIQAIQFKADSNLLELSDGVYCFKQITETGPLHKVTKKEALKVMKLHKKKKWTWSDFKLASSVHFVTPEACYPCHIWAGRQVCYHQLAVRSLTGAGDLPQDDDDDTIRAPDNRRGRPKRKRARFTSERLFEAAQKGAQKRRRRPHY